MFTSIKIYCDSLVSDFSKIAPKRKKRLELVAAYISGSLADGCARLIYICTHNSRRSHFAQVWSTVATEYFKAGMIESYSGGTEVTAVHPSVLKSLEKCGFLIDKDGAAINPRIKVYYDKNKFTICFSKLYKDGDNPGENFAAIMTCSEADENCPYIPGATARFPLPYNDPKVYDGTSQQEDRYDETCRLIALEIFYLYSKINS